MAAWRKYSCRQNWIAEYKLLRLLDQETAWTPPDSDFPTIEELMEELNLPERNREIIRFHYRLSGERYEGAEPTIQAQQTAEHFDTTAVAVRSLLARFITKARELVGR